jgi:DUF2075 family protein
MLVYSETKANFLGDVDKNIIHSRILDKLKEKTWHGTGESEISSWRNSMNFMGKILSDPEIPHDSQISIEYMIPLTSKRVDIIISGRNESQHGSVVIVELKQWSKAEKTEKDGVVRTFIGGAERDASHPSYQAWTYGQLIKDYNLTVQEEQFNIVSCAYLHNMDDGSVIRDDFYRPHLDRAPAFISNDSDLLKSFIKKHIKYGDGTTMYRLENSQLRPSKDLADSLSSMLSGNIEYTMIDDQKLIYEEALRLAKLASGGKKQVLLVQGGPGTGKSVVAINLLVELTNRNLVCQYVSKNAAPRHVYSEKLSGIKNNGRLKNLFRSSGSYMETKVNTFDVLIVDEAHRLVEKSGFYGNEGENQIKEIVNAAKLAIFFLDEDQRVTFADIGRKSLIQQFATEAKASMVEAELTSQFRCNGSDGYLAWLDDTLQIRETANESLDSAQYEFEVFDDPSAMRERIEELNSIRNKSRLVAGYCWNWVSRINDLLNDIVIPEFNFEAKWNLASDGSGWIIAAESVKEIGCIHTCQGLELDYVGVLIGDDLIYRDGKLQTNPAARAKSDKSLKGYKKLETVDPRKANARADAIIRNTYKTLMTRGSKGCFIFCTDQATGEYFKAKMAKQNTQTM